MVSVGSLPPPFHCLQHGWVLDTHTLSLQFRRGCGCRWAPIGGGRERPFVLRGSEAAGVSSACSAAEVKGHLYWRGNGKRWSPDRCSYPEHNFPRVQREHCSYHRTQVKVAKPWEWYIALMELLPQHYAFKNGNFSAYYITWIRVTVPKPNVFVTYL